jgi:hypothetical protein
VLITAPCLNGGRALVAGESLRASCRPAPADAPHADGAPVAPEPPAERADSQPRPPTRARLAVRAEPAPAWRALAKAQDYRGALDAAIKLGFDGELRRSSVDDLLVLGDVARLAGDSTRALQAYEAARRRGTASDRSAFAIGLVEFDHRRRFRQAAEWFATYVAEQPGGPLAEEAQGRLIEAWQRAGEEGKARAVGQVYLARYPRGQYADLARHLTR